MKKPIQMGVKMVRIMAHCNVTLDLVNAVDVPILWIAWDAKNQIIAGAKHIQTNPNSFLIVFICIIFLVHYFFVHLIR